MNQTLQESNFLTIDDGFNGIPSNEPPGYFVMSSHGKGLDGFSYIFLSSFDVVDIWHMMSS